jgi:transcriptional regulator with XRE-family HTH domain
LSSSRQQKPANLAQLAKKLGYSRTTLARWKRIEGSPAGYDVMEWRQWITAHGAGIAGNRAPISLSKLREDKLAKEIEKLDLQIARERRTVVAVDEVERLLLTIATRQKQHLYAVFGGELPVALEGQAADMIRQRLVTVADEICDVMRDRVEAWHGGDA